MGRRGHGVHVIDLAEEVCLPWSAGRTMWRCRAPCSAGGGHRRVCAPHTTRAGSWPAHGSIRGTASGAVDVPGGSRPALAGSSRPGGAEGGALGQACRLGALTQPLIAARARLRPVMGQGNGYGEPGSALTCFPLTIPHHPLVCTVSVRLDLINIPKPMQMETSDVPSVGDSVRAPPPPGGCRSPSHVEKA